VQPRPSGPSLPSFNATLLNRRHSNPFDTLPRHPFNPAASSVTQQWMRAQRQLRVAPRQPEL